MIVHTVSLKALKTFAVHAHTSQSGSSREFVGSYIMVVPEPQPAVLSTDNPRLSFPSSESECSINSNVDLCILANSASQPFWGRVVAACGGGPLPIAYRDLSADKLFNAIQVCRSAEAKTAAEAIAARMRQESGVDTAVQSFHRRLPTSQLCCDILPQHAARWIYKPKKSKHASVKLSNEALVILLDSKDVSRSRVHP